ncbi:MAG: MarR family winged helix-turn-helix transcriptional regulator [Halothermotrichaceae bacterium]
MEGNDFEPLGKYLSIVFRTLNSILDNKLQEYNIARGEFPFLLALYHKQGVSQQQLSDYYLFDKAVAVRVINKLVKKGFVRREKDPEDKRQYKIYLSSKGQKFKPTFMNILEITEKTMVKGLSSCEKRQFISTLKTIAENLGVNCEKCEKQQSLDCR